MVFGAGVSRLPFLYEPNGNLAVLPYLATWVLVGFVAGILFPEACVEATLKSAARAGAELHVDDGVQAGLCEQFRHSDGFAL